MMRYKIPLMALALSACSTLYPPHDTSTQDKIKDTLTQAAEVKAKPAPALPESVSRSLLPPLNVAMPRASAKQLEQRFDLVVSDVPIDQVLMGIVSGTRYSMLVQPKNTAANPQAPAGSQPASAMPEVTDKISVNLKDVTVFEALEAIRETYGYEYRLDGTRIYVQPPGLQIKVYQVNYIPGMRRGMSDLRVIGGASSNSGSSSNSSGSSGTSTGAGIGTGSNSGQNAGANQIQASALRTGAKADVWGEVEDTIRTVLGCRIPQQTQKGVGNATNSNVSFPGEPQTGDRDRGVDGCTDGRAMTINQMSGTILVRGMPEELRTIEGILRTMQLNIERQVMIEAKIIDVELNADSQQGINWAGFQNGTHRFSLGSDTKAIGATGSSFTRQITTDDGAGNTTDVTSTITPIATNGGPINAGTSLGALLGTAMMGPGGAVAAGMGIAMQLRNFTAMIEFLQTQGTLHVLSSPRISTLNNQKAVLKVGVDEQFVAGIETSTSSNITNSTVSGSASSPPIFATYFSGISLDVTPQIDEADNITLHVHPLISSIAEVEKRVGGFTANGSPNTLPFASNNISETDSVVKVKDGQVVVIGGLMTERVRDDRAKVPGAGDAPAVGSLFRKGAQRSSKRELVILLKPTIVRNDDTAWTDDITATQQRIGDMNQRPQVTPGNQ